MDVNGARSVLRGHPSQAAKAVSIGAHQSGNVRLERRYSGPHAIWGFAPGWKLFGSVLLGVEQSQTPRYLCRVVL